MHAVIVFHKTIKEDASHSNGHPREVRVIVHALADLDTSRRVDVARQESVDVVLNVNCKRQLELKVKFNVQQLHGGP